jgi:hypothetical protein
MRSQGRHRLVPPPVQRRTAELIAEAKAKVAGATVLRGETDAGDGAYEVHMQKSDGSLVTVKFDKNLNITAVEDGMGKGDPMPAGGAAPSGADRQLRWSSRG